MSYLSYSASILNLLYIALFERRSNEIIKYLTITNPGFAVSKPLGGLMVRPIKRVPATPRDLVVNRKGFFNHVLRAVSGLSAFFEKLNVLFSTKNSKNTCCLGVV